MSEYSSLKATINANVKTNDNHEITGSIMNSVLNAMVNSLGAGYQFMGVATPTNPGSAQTPDYKCFYLATTPGTYTNQGGLVVESGEVALLIWDTAWRKRSVGNFSACDYVYGADVEKNVGVVESTDGSVWSGASNNFYIRVPVAYVKTVDVQMFRTTHTYGLAFFDKNGDYIGGECNNTEDSGTRFIYNVPQGASYMLYSYLTDDAADANNAPHFSGVRLELGVDIIAEEINKMSGVSNWGRDLFDMSQHGVVNTTTGAIEGQGQTSNFYKKLDVAGCWAVDIPVFHTGSVYGVGFYDANDNYISGYANTSLPGGTRYRLNIPVGAKYFIFSYVTDATAQAQGIPEFDYIKIYSSDPDTIGGLKLEISQMSDSPKRSRPQSGAESFSVNINSRIPSLDTNLAIGDTDVPMVDYGIIQLPENYSPTGTPVPLAIVCHGAGAVLSQYKNPVVVDGKAMGDPSKYLVQKGYACMDMFGLPESLGYGSELHVGNPRTLLCYLAGYEYVIKNYNVRTDKVFVSGSSMGGLSSFQIVQSGLFPVAAQAGFCPCIDLFKQAYCDPWGSSVRPSIATYFEFEGTRPTWTYGENTPPSQAEIDYFVANYEKIVGYNPIANMLMDGDYKDTFDYIPQDLTALIDPTEKAIYDNFRATHPVPLKIWHCKDDYVVAFRYSAYIIDMLRKAGRIAFLRPFNTGGHSAWDNGDVVYDTDVSGNTITTHVSERECYLWFERFK